MGLSIIQYSVAVWHAWNSNPYSVEFSTMRQRPVTLCTSCTSHLAPKPLQFPSSSSDFRL